MTKSDLTDYTNKVSDGLRPERKIKRWSRDKNEMFWNFGKVHGLENISELSDETLEQIAGDPFKFQEALNRVEADGYSAESSEAHIQEILKAL